MIERKCKTCGKPLDVAESYREEPMCDLCVIKRGRDRDIASTMKDKIAAIPKEYSDCGNAINIIYDTYKTDVRMFRDKNIFVGADKHRAIKMGWSIYKALWEAGRTARMENFIEWYTRYTSSPDSRWDMMVDMADFEGVIILNIDTLYGVKDQSILYSMLQTREDRGNKTCVLHNVSGGDLLDPMLSSFLNDKINNYVRVLLVNEKT